MNHASPHGGPSRRDASSALSSLPRLAMPELVTARIDCCLEGVGMRVTSGEIADRNLLTLAPQFCRGICPWTGGAPLERCPDLKAGGRIRRMGAVT